MKDNYERFCLKKHMVPKSMYNFISVFKFMKTETQKLKHVEKHPGELILNYLNSYFLGEKGDLMLGKLSYFFFYMYIIINVLTFVSNYYIIITNIFFEK